MEISREIIAKAKSCETEEELKALAKENKVEVTDEEIKLFLADNAEGELEDSELEAVSGGKNACRGNAYTMVFFPTEDEVRFVFNVDDVAQAFVGKNIISEITAVRITERTKKGCSRGWYDLYKYENITDGTVNQVPFWHNRTDFLK